MALPMLVWLGIDLLITRGLSTALITTVPPALVYQAWYAAYGRSAARTPLASGDLIVQFAWTGIADVWESVLVLPGVGGLLFLLLVATAFLLPSTPARPLVVSGLATTVVSFFLLGASRASLGIEAAAAGRYAYFAMQYTLPAVVAASLLSHCDFVRPTTSFLLPRLWPSC